MATVSLKAYRAITTVLSTGLNSLANGTNSAASSAYDNTSNLDPLVDIELNLTVQGSARSAGATVDVYMVTRLDGTNFPDINETTAELVASFVLDAATTARRAVIRDIALPPEQVEFFLRNRTGQAFNASGSTVKIAPHAYTIA